VSWNTQYPSAGSSSAETRPLMPSSTGIDGINGCFETRPRAAVGISTPSTPK
jgi:hypothetical protein